VALAIPAAAAAHDPLSGGSTKLKLKPAVASALADAGIGVAPVAPAAVKNNRIAFPITGGRIDSGHAKGSIEHAGGLEFSAGANTVAIGDFVVKLGDRPKLLAATGAPGLRVFDLDVSKAEVTREGFATKITGVKAVLTANAARALNSALGVDAFAGGLVVGHVRVLAEPESVRLRAEGSTNLVLDPGAADALASLGIKPGVIAPATAGADGLAFPITGGRVNAETLAGTIRHSGGISLSKHSTKVDLKQFYIEIDDAPDLTANVGGSRVSILSLDLSGASIEVDGLDVTVSGVVARLTADAAAALNAAFGTTAFAEGLQLGTATVKATVR
jgi:hypothetical protein